MPSLSSTIRSYLKLPYEKISYNFIKPPTPAQLNSIDNGINPYKVINIFIY